ncbi:hypothetical protein K469DRAFT_714613 [Zopfia rhizophila CBS 207.26]|uniref:Uncharacterized protein n=1 Tax=Zopfia rhizophila CBS 207.26 TaxID=1314779 RepID=A0A6A6DQF6_9PEZI|nr:hypothetical protein K469DRAFT_714613 [Zopfia rhizophila CBS 207.26]
MPQFLDLPRELRDMIYLAVITAEVPQPTLGKVHWMSEFQWVFEPQSSSRGEYGCGYSLDQAPQTCANLLACNRQIYTEMGEIIQIAKRKDMVRVKLDCIAEDECLHYFTWMAIPLVKTSTNVGGRSRTISSWADRMMDRYLTCPYRLLSSGCLAGRSSSTLISQLWVDVRLFGDRSRKWFRNSNPPDRTSWAICAALKQVLEKGPNFSTWKNSGNTTTVDELVLNIVPQPSIPKERYLPEDFPIGEMRDGVVHPRTVAKELVDVWNRIWSAEDFKGGFYWSLIERIKRVKVCINEETFRVRELRAELERGQEEQRRIAARVGW